MSSTTAVDRDNNETVIDTGIGAQENAEENVEVPPWQSATQGSRKEPSIANSRSPRGQQIDEMELQNLRAKEEAEQRLRERQLEKEQEREELELRRRQEKLQLRQHEQEPENKRQKAEADEDQKRMKIELTKGSLRASGSQVDVLESV